MIIRCPKCKRLVETSRDRMGRKEVCQFCDNIFVVDDSVMYKEEQSVSTPAAPLAPEQPPKPRQAKKSISPALAIAVIAGCLLIVAAVIVLVSAPSRTSVEPPSYTPEGASSSPSRAQPRLVTRKIASGTYKVEAGKYTYWTFSCRKGDKLKGTVATMGSYINVWLIKETREFEAFQRKESFYHIRGASAKKTSLHTIDTAMGAGTYYLVLDNTSSWVTGIGVAIDLEVSSWE